VGARKWEKNFDVISMTHT